MSYLYTTKTYVGAYEQEVPQTQNAPKVLSANSSATSIELVKVAASI